MDYAPALAVATAAALEAGRHLRAEFHRPGGPRGRSGHAPIDEEVERLLRDRLTAAFPAFGLRGEELGAEDRPPRPRRVALLARRPQRRHVGDAGRLPRGGRVHRPRPR